MDIKLLKQYIANKSPKKTISEAPQKYATKYPGIAITVPPDDEGTVVISNGTKMHLRKGDVVTIKTNNGQIFSNVTLHSVVDVKYEGLGGQVRFEERGALRGMSANGIQSLTKSA